MDQILFDDFIASGDSLWVYQAGKPPFTSRQNGLFPLLEFIHRFPSCHEVLVFDKIIGNAAALLAVKAQCREAYSPLGSQEAAKTLEKYGIKYSFGRTIPYILKFDRQDICPMEKLSLGQKPEEFYRLISLRLKMPS